MHSRIYELSEKPVPEAERFAFEDVPEWFFDTIADYADDTNDAHREEEIKWLTDYFENLCTVEGDKLTFDPQTPEKRLRGRYARFLEKATVLTATSYEAFCGKLGSPTLEHTLFEVNDAYEDKFGFYVFDHESLELQTLHSWLRTSDLSQPYYVGGIVDYHW